MSGVDKSGSRFRWHEPSEAASWLKQKSGISGANFDPAQSQIMHIARSFRKRRPCINSPFGFPKVRSSMTEWSPAEIRTKDPFKQYKTTLQSQRHETYTNKT
jgi:hypothetical protein